MKRVLALSICLAATSVSAGSLQDSIVEQLQDQGFTRIQISRTLLGRSRIVATTKTMTREIVINPATGTILRDYWEDRSKNGVAADLFNPEAGRDGTGTSSGDTDSDDDSDDGGEDASGGDEGDSAQQWNQFGHFPLSFYAEHRNWGEPAISTPRRAE